MIITLEILNYYSEDLHKARVYCANSGQTMMIFVRWLFLQTCEASFMKNLFLFWPSLHLTHISGEKKPQLLQSLRSFLQGKVEMLGEMKEVEGSVGMWALENKISFHIYI